MKKGILIDVGDTLVYNYNINFANGFSKVFDLAINPKINKEEFVNYANSLLKDERKYWCYYPTNRNIPNLIRNTFLALKVLIKEKPDIIISSGAAVSIPFFFLGKILGKKLVYIEVFDRIDKPTVSGRFCYKFADKFIVQWDEQLDVYPKAINLGRIF